MFRLIRSVSPALLALALAGCGGAPSESDIDAALKKQFANDEAQMQRIGGVGAAMIKAMAPEVKQVRKIGCKEDGEKAYRCDVELKVVQSGSESNNPMSLRFLKTSEGWAVGR